MKTKLYIIPLALLLSSCEKFIEVDPPVQLVVGKAVYETDETASSALTGLYANMMRTNFFISYYVPYYCGLYADELEYKQTAPLISALYKNVLNPKDAPTNIFWNNSYNIIYQANSILKGVDNSQTLSAGVKSQLKGEALFIRAFFHYYLCGLYGEIPIITSTDYNINSISTKSSVNDVYKQIILDLIESKTLLTSKYVGGNSITESSTRVRPNVFAVSALLSRIYLITKEWKKAITESNLVINSGLYQLEKPELVFKKVSKEVILQIELPPGAVSNSYEATYFTLKAKPSVASQFRSATLSKDLLLLFDNNDLRKSNWIGTFKETNVTPNIIHNYPAKYKSSTSVNVDEATTPLRLGEIFLIRAEAYTQMENRLAGIDDLDRIRSRAGITLIKDSIPNISKSELLTVIETEKRKELFCEWGIRWLDIRRAENRNTIMTGIALKKGSVWQNFMGVWPIPQNDILNNKNLIQNDGYN